MPRARQFHRFALAIVATAALGACGGDNRAQVSNGAAKAPSAASAGTASVPDPCELLTSSEVATVMGESNATPRREAVAAGPGGVAHQCTWSGPQPAPGAIAARKTIALVAYDGEQYYAAIQQAPGRASVSGIGDKATIAGNILMWVQRGLTLQLQFAWADRPRSEVEGLARKAARRVG